jgi:hypothetical protein
MLISYPILPARQNAESEDAYLTRLLTTYVNADEGRYPISSLNAPGGTVHRWHGGVHLVGGGEPIRAIADGFVSAFRAASQLETYPGQGDYDTSFVLLRHDTQSGENTGVEFYSLYMHLAHRGSLQPDRFQRLPEWLRQAAVGPNVQRPANVRVWRKEVLGFAGTLYGRETCHFEVFATDAAFTRFWRDSTATTQGNGSADFFGDAHFVIPAQQTFAATHPNADGQGRVLIQDPPGTLNDLYYTLAPGQAGQNQVPLCVSVSFARGSRATSTYEAGPASTWPRVGQPVQQDDYEYELYRLALAMYPDCPSAGFEWLRFGRVLGPETTTRNENWQLVRYSPAAMGYVNLASATIAKLSDADFVHWQGWERRDEGVAAGAADGICDDERTIALAQAGDEVSRTKARHLICRAPSEWDASDLDARYARLREAGQPLNDPEAWQRFEQHVQRMAFWGEAALGDRSVWHFHPFQFVRHYRRCGWLSQRELLQLVPDHIIRKPGSHNSGTQGIWEAPAIGPATNLMNTHAVALNQALRKFCLDTPLRRACFFGNAVQETAWFRLLRESNGNDPTLHAGWYGRGFLQLTNPNGSINGGNNNYYKYFGFLGRNPGVPPGAQEITWRDQVGTDPYHAAHSATAYWVWPNKSVPTIQNPNRPQVDSANKYADVSAVNQRRTIATAAGTKVWYYNQSFTNCAAAVNYPATVGQSPPNMNGLVDRSTAFVNALMVLDDMITFNDSQGGTQTEPENFQRRTVP